MNCKVGAQRDISPDFKDPIIAVVIPSFRVRNHILDVLARIGPEVSFVYVVDDACPDRSGDLVESSQDDHRVKVLRHKQNEGVGGAVLTGYIQAIQDGAHIIVKIDGDGQMDPGLIPALVGPILRGDADYSKGNRFFDLRRIDVMPRMRIVGNLGLSFMSKLSTGYWDVFDPTNGFTAIHSSVAARLPFESLSRRYFFETDMLFRLNTLRAVVSDVPMDAQYGNEVSGLKISQVFGEFLSKHLRNTFKRIVYNYFLRDLSIASLELLAGSLLMIFGLGFGGYNWAKSAATAASTPVGTIMIATISVVAGLQFLLAFFGYDIANVPRRAVHPLFSSCLPRREARELEERS